MQIGNMKCVNPPSQPTVAFPTFYTTHNVQPGKSVYFSPSPVLVHKKQSNVSQPVYPGTHKYTVITVNFLTLSLKTMLVV